MKILFVNEYRVMAGAEKIVDTLIEYMKERGHDVVYIAGVDAKPGYFIHHFEDAFFSLNPDVVHFHNITGNVGIEPIIMCIASGIPWLLTMHDYYIGCRNRMYYKNGKMCDATNQDNCSSCVNHVHGLPHPQVMRKILGNGAVVCISESHKKIIDGFGYNAILIRNGIDG